ncbi:MAG: phosphate starvation-inducible protein PhoH, partial [Pseudomonadota bacterium]
MPTVALGETYLDPAATETVIEFPDNRLLIDLCGQYDRNIAQLEQAFGVEIRRRGNQLAAYGPVEARGQAHAALVALYERLESGRTVEPADIDAIVRMGPAPEEPAAPDEQLD